MKLRHENERLSTQLNHLLGRAPTEAALREWPLTISMNESGDFARGHSWNLSVNSAGQAQLTIHVIDEDTIIHFLVSHEQLTELRKLLIRENFFGLASFYGEVVPGGSMQTITISVGEFTRTLQIGYLMNWVNYEPEKLRDPARAVRVGLLIRSWFEHPDANDSRSYDKMVLDALQKYSERHEGGTVE